MHVHKKIAQDYVEKIPTSQQKYCLNRCLVMVATCHGSRVKYITITISNKPLRK